MLNTQLQKELEEFVSTNTTSKTTLEETKEILRVMGIRQPTTNQGD